MLAFAGQKCWAGLAKALVLLIVNPLILATPALTLDGLGYVQVESNSVSNDTNIALGFKTRDTKGIIIGIGSPVSYIVAEILGDRVGVSVKLKTG